jgi:hypothetical protein
MKDKTLLRLATYRPGDARHATPTNISRLQKILDMPGVAISAAKAWKKPGQMMADCGDKGLYYPEPHRRM